MEDYCAQCTTDYPSLQHIDIWTGDATNGGDVQIACENALTPDAQQAVVRSPAADLAVDAGALWDAAGCHTDRVYLGADVGADCSAATTPACATGCSWAGHCVGESCFFSLEMVSLLGEF